MKIRVDQILPNPEQPRTIFDEYELHSLAQSIKETGLIQPIIMEAEGDQYILIDGERRLRAAKILELPDIEAVVRQPAKSNGKERLTQALVANIQRSQMGYVDEAKAYQILLDELGSIEAVCDKTGMSTATISGRLALLEFAPLVQKMYNLKKLPFDLSLLAALKRLGPEDQETVASHAATRGLRTTSILRAITKMIKQRGEDYKPTKRQAPPPNRMAISMRSQWCLENCRPRFGAQQSPHARPARSMPTQVCRYATNVRFPIF